MKKIYLFLAAMASVALVGCTSDLLVADTPSQLVDDEEGSAIIFSSLSKGTTRADFKGAEAAEKLGKKFVVSGYKGKQTAFSTTDPKSTIVFDNYVVEYAENTAHTTESNVANWEYVGKGRIKHAIDNGITRQTIKYWDYNQPQYDFIAWSTGSKTAIYEGTPTAGQVLVSAITPETATGTGTGKVAYTFTGKADDLSACYIADLVTVKKAQYASHQDAPVTFQFRQLGTKVRIGIYETIPGYSVKDVKFYTTGGILTNPGTQIVNNATIFSAGADIYKEGTYTVTFPTVDKESTDPDYANNNQAHVTFAPKSGATQATTVDWGALNYTIAEDGEKTAGNKFLGRTSNTASFAGDPEKNYYDIYLPNETGANLNLRVDFTLESIDGGGEEIFVKNAKAQVPSIYTTWKPGFAYTYLFKISDKTNGRTGVYDPTKADDATVNSDPAGLYPITFDAVVVNAEDGDHTQETITTVMTPSITTYQQKSTVVNADEYTPGKDIFVTVNEGDALVTMTNTNPATDKDAALYTLYESKTEAEVVDALQMQDDDAAAGTIKGRNGLVLTEAPFTLTNSVEFGADGNAIGVAANQALRFSPTTATTYAFVYTKKAPTAADVVKYQALNWGSFAAGQTKYRYEYKAPTHSYYNVNNNGTPDDDTDDITTEYFDAQKGVKYFAVSGGVYTMQTPFIGQGVGNLYLDATGTSIARGYAATGTTYYYTVDNGMTYQAATNIAYEAFATTTLYTDPACTTAKTETTPVNGQAYYDAAGKYCVILPQQTTGWYELDETTYVVANETAEVVGMTYFDKYVKNDGEYYVKVIKVQ